MKDNRKRRKKKRMWLVYVLMTMTDGLPRHGARGTSEIVSKTVNETNDDLVVDADEQQNCCC